MSGGLIGLACLWMENRSSTAVEKGKLDLKLLSVVDEQDRNFFNPTVRSLKRVVSPDSASFLSFLKNVKLG